MPFWWYLGGDILKTDEIMRNAQISQQHSLLCRLEQNKMECINGESIVDFGSKLTQQQDM